MSLIPSWSKHQRAKVRKQDDIKYVSRWEEIVNLIYPSHTKITLSEEKLWKISHFVFFYLKYTFPDGCLLLDAQKRKKEKWGTKNNLWSRSKRFLTGRSKSTKRVWLKIADNIMSGAYWSSYIRFLPSNYFSEKIETDQIFIGKGPEVFKTYWTLKNNLTNHFRTNHDESPSRKCDYKFEKNE